MDRTDSNGPRRAVYLSNVLYPSRSFEVVPKLALRNRPKSLMMEVNVGMSIPACYIVRESTENLDP